MTADDAATCGMGLADHSRLPARLGELTAAVADVLEHHLTTLDLTDEYSRREDEAYRSLVAHHRRVAGELQAIAAEMAGYRTLPMGRHDLEALARPDAMQPFARFVRLEEELLALLEERLDSDRAMLDHPDHPPEPV